MDTKSSSSIFHPKLFSILHVSLSIGLVIVIVHNQLAYESRFKKIEEEIEIRQKPTAMHKQAIKELRRPKFKHLEKEPAIDNVGHREKRSIKSDHTTATNKQKLLNYKNSTFKVQENNNSDVITCLDLLQNFLRVNNVPGKIAKLDPCERLRGPPGKPGSRGPRGRTGRRGVRGQKGKTGNKGSIGKHGPPGPRGEKGFSGNLTVIGIKGDMGPKGIKGNKGDIGIRGQKGTKGQKGDFGGPKGEQGKRGEKGNTGPRGCPGDTLAAPSFFPSPRNLVFKENQPAVLLCNASANPYSRITWYHDNVTLSSSDSSKPRYKVEEKVVKMPDKRNFQCNLKSHPVTQSSMVIKRSRSSDTGNYICEAHNVMGVFRYEIRLLIQVYVQFTTVPSNITVVENDDVQLSCRALGVPSPLITWHRKDIGVMPNKFKIVRGDLQIFGITKEQEGLYVCVASNVLGAKTVEVFVTVNVPPVIKHFFEHSLTINENENLTLPCNATGYPTPTIEWYKRSGPLPEGRYIFNIQMLIVSNVHYKDGGEYVCIANNTVGAVTKRARVIVQVGPKIIQKPKDVEYGYKGKTKRLNFEVFAFPLASIKWKKLDNTKMSHRFRQEIGNLVVENVEYTDSGLYQATARNILGEVKVNTFLIIKEPVSPVISSFGLETKFSVPTGTNFSRTCSAVGIPKPKLIWKHEDKNITSVASDDSADGLTLRIVNVTFHDNGRYTCEAINEFGIDRQHIDLEVNTNISDSFFANGAGRLGKIQTFQTKQTGLYVIRAGGARGGKHSYNYGYKPGTYYGGRGATMEGQFRLSYGTTLTIVVGQKGGNSVEIKGGRLTTRTAADLGQSVEDNAGTGGGGGTFVYTASNTLLLAAGGGGGASAGYNGIDGQSGTVGTASVGKEPSKSRAGGKGGGSGQCNSAGASYHGGVGAGWNGQGCVRLGKQHGERGGSREQGWHGGKAGAMNSGLNGGPSPGAVGGFGGGGGGSEDNGASGGGGGYSGGGSGTHENQAGGGGGSFCGGTKCLGKTGGNLKDDGFLEIWYLGK